MEPRPGRAPSVLRQFGQAAILADETYGHGIVSRLSTLVFILIFVPIGIVTFFVTGLVFYAVMVALGPPTGTLGAVAALAWLGGTLALLVVIFVWLFRRLPRRLKALATDPTAILVPVPKSGARPSARRPIETKPPPPGPTLSELDSRFAPPARPIAGDEGE